MMNEERYKGRRLVLGIGSACAALWLGLSVGRASPPDGHFVVNGDGTVSDTATGLVWQRWVPNSTYTWANAGTFCADLALGGSSSWRLPTVAELQTIVDEERWNPAVDPVAFAGTPSTRFWTSTPSNSASLAWFVDFGVGYANTEDVRNGFDRVRCVR